jgi:tRNA-specific 2-thiouridylase
MKIAVALSGGVDSTAVALRLKKAGHDVFGITMQICPDLSELSAPKPKGALRPGLPGHGCAHCEAPCACVDATSVAHELGIPLELVDWREAFENHVIQPFVTDFSSGLTPNPCALCNRAMKFGLMRQRALELGADAYATGHYIRLEEEAGTPVLRRAVDPSRDQSYFLSLVPIEQFKQVIFPLGGSFKTDNKAEVDAAGVHVQPPVTSNEICFLRDIEYTDFLKLRTPESFKPGAIADTHGKILGQHQGLPAYTIGQRRGLGIAAAEPLYVIRLNAETNQVIAGSNADLWATEVHLREMNWLIPVSASGVEVHAQVRYRQIPAPARVFPGESGTARVCFEKPVRAITPGQITALYDNDRLLGGGRIT